MWLRISAQHLKNAADNQHALEQRFFEYCFQPEHDVMAHITEIETIANQLRDINAPVTESQLMTKIICTLPPSYRGFMSAWDSVPVKDRTIDTLTSRLLKEESMTRQWSRGKLDSQDAAFFAHNFPSFGNNSRQTTTPRGRGRGRFGRGASRGDQASKRQHPYKFCTYIKCNIPGHTIEVCRKRLKDEKESRNNHSQAAPAVASDSNKESTKDTAATDEESAYMSATCFLSRRAEDWFADSGATGHMTDQRSFFTSFTPVILGTWTVKGIGSSRLYVCGHGSINFLTTVNGIKRTLAVDEVLYVPGLGTSLLSIAAVTDVGLSVHFIETQVSFKKKPNDCNDG
jgi:hypothetical protein